MSKQSAIALVADDLFELLSVEDEEHDIAFHEFFGDFAGHDQQDQWEMMLFQEWLLFDWRPAGGQSLLERGLTAPSLTKEQHERCRQLLSNVYSQWQLVECVPGYGITLEDIYNGKRYKVRDKEAGTDLPIDSVFYTRLVSINDHWELASGFIELQVLNFKQANRSDFFGKRPKVMSPRTLLTVHRGYAKEPLKRSDSVNIPEATNDEARRVLQKVLKQSGLNQYVTLETVNKWILADKHHPVKQTVATPYPLALSLLLGLGINCSESTIRKITAAVIALQRSVTKPAASAKQQPEAITDKSFINVFDPADWLDIFDKTIEYMRDHKEQEAVALFEQGFQLMHVNHTTSPLVFRQLHNAALAYFYTGEETLGRKALAASLALNPAYDQGLGTQQALDEGKLDYLLFTTKLNRMLTNQKKGQRLRLSPRQRSVSPVTKYYDWLKDLGINFYDDSPSDTIRNIGDPTNSQKAVNAPISRPHKPGRNAP